MAKFKEFLHNTDLLSFLTGILHFYDAVVSSLCTCVRAYGILKRFLGLTSMLNLWAVKPHNNIVLILYYASLFNFFFAVSNK